MSYDPVPGMRVVCIEETPLSGYGNEALPQPGRVYTIRDVGVDDYSQVVCLWLDEVVNSVRRYKHTASGDLIDTEPAFPASRFRPLDERRLDIFRKALRKAPSPKVEEDA